LARKCSWWSASSIVYNLNKAGKSHQSWFTVNLKKFTKSKKASANTDAVTNTEHHVVTVTMRGTTELLSMDKLLIQVWHSWKVNNFKKLTMTYIFHTIVNKELQEFVSKNNIEELFHLHTGNKRSDVAIEALFGRPRLSWQSPVILFTHLHNCSCYITWVGLSR
jgi:hypothetical protein